jgi:Na+/melibiose symporter-like transporter
VTNWRIRFAFLSREKVRVAGKARREEERVAPKQNLLSRMSHKAWAFTMLAFCLFSLLVVPIAGIGSYLVDQVLHCETHRTAWIMGIDAALVFSFAALLFLAQHVWQRWRRR